MLISHHYLTYLRIFHYIYRGKREFSKKDEKKVDKAKEQKKIQETISKPEDKKDEKEEKAIPPSKQE